METLFLVAANDELGGFCGGRINVSRSALENSAGPISKLRRDYPDLDFKLGTYESAGGDCISIGFVGEGVIAAMEIPGCQQAAKQLNLMLMRKGPTFQWRWHCFDLADWAVRAPLTEINLKDLLENPVEAKP